MSIRRTFLITVLLALLLAPLTGWSANGPGVIDPLLIRLQAERQQKSADDYSAVLSKVIALEETADATNPRIGVILRLDGGLPNLYSVPGLVIGSVRGSIATARLPLSSLPALAAHEGIARIEASRRFYPTLDAAIPAGRVNQVWAGAPAYTGEGVLVGVIDSGVDWTHDDFKNNDGTTRIKAIWDLYGTGTPPAGFNYGAEYNEAQINAGTVNQRDFSGHGTHVTGIAAGNGRASSGLYKGVAPEADILFAKPYSDEFNGFASDKTIDAINYLVAKAASLDRPIAINMSLGGHQGPHDGTTAQEVVIDDIVGEGVVICIAGGNEGEAYLHQSASAGGGSMSFAIQEFYTANPSDGDDYAVVEIWVEGPTSISITTPGGNTVGPVNSGNGSAAWSTAHGVVLVDNASAGTDPANGDQMILVQLDDQDGIALAGGEWTFNFTGGSGDAHAWKLVSTMPTGFVGSDQSYSIATPGTAENALTVAAWKTRNNWPSSAGNRSYGGDWGAIAVGDLAPFSSIGPTRDGRQKPDLAAPGMAIIACYSSDQNPSADASVLLTGGDYTVSQGTSMASPYACGVVALMLEKNSTLTADEIKAALRSTADADAYTGTTWNQRFGAGKIDAAAAIAAIEVGGAIPNGDVDLSGTTTVLDVILMVNHILDDVGNPLSPEAAANANVNGDSVIDALDLVRVVAFILGTDAPGKVAADPARFVLGDPVYSEGRWWVEATLTGADLAAAQFALQLPAANWDAAAIRVDNPASVEVAARAVGTNNEQLRVLIYDLDNHLPSAGVTLHLPFESVAGAPQEIQLAGLRVADPHGEERAVLTEKAGATVAAQLGVYPNPMSSTTNIQFGVGRSTGYSVAVYDLRGRRVRQLEQGSVAASSVIAWDGLDASGRAVPSGVYFVQLTTLDEVLTRKVILSR